MQNEQALTQEMLRIMGTMNKRQIVAACRTAGWKGDEARTLLQTLVQWLARHNLESQHQQDGQHQQGGNDASTPPEQQQDGQQGKGEQQQQGDAPEQQQQGEGESDQGEGTQGDAPAGADAEGQGEGEQQQGDAQQGEGESSQGEQSKGDGQQGQQSDAQQGEQQQGKGDKGEQSQQQGEGQGQGEQQQQQQEPPQGEQQQDGHPRPLTNAEWKSLLRAKGVQHPHPLLRKVFEYARQGINLYLCGPAGCGKTYLSEQLALLRDAPFGFISVTLGMSESQLLGWRMPVGEGLAFSYVPSAFVSMYRNGGVFLLDECDAGDANTLVILNAALANNQVAVPQCVESPIIKKHPLSVLVAAGNTPLGGGASEMYNARVPIDASTGDRLLQVNMDYDPRYEASCFPGAELPAPKGYWRPVESVAKGEPIPSETWQQARAAFDGIRAAVAQHKIPRLVSTRFAQKLVACLRAGETIKGALADLTASWSEDEVRRSNVAQFSR